MQGAVLHKRYRGGRQNYTPSCIAAVLGNSPADIFEKTVWVWAAFERARKVDIWP